MTTVSEHDEFLPLLAGEMLGGLDEDETRRLEAHRQGCDRCADDAGAMAGLVVDLGLTAPPRMPSASLAVRVDAIARDEPAVAPSPPRDDTAPIAQTAPTEPGGWRALLRRPAVALAASALAVVLAVAATGAVLQAGRLADAVATRDGLIAVLADPTHVQASLAADDPAVTAMAVYVPGSTDAYVMATGLPATDADHVYQLWSADEAGVHPLGTFRHDGDGPFVAPFGVDLGAATAAMVTLEPTGGVQGDVPGPEVVFGELAPEAG